jgi:hypothetical protein
MYSQPTADEPLTQGDILDACPIFGLESGPGGVDLEAAPARWKERIIVLTQACDLAQTKTTKVLVALVQSAQFLVDRGILSAATIRDQLRRSQVYGWYFLPAAPAPVEFPESIIDLRDVHTVPRGVLERLVADGKRRCRLSTPYREHLAQHFAVTYMRIGLPSPYETRA